MNDSKKFVELLSSSQVYKDYERAFSEITGLPITLRPVEIWGAALNGKKHGNPFCALMARGSRTCSACLEIQQKISDPKATQTKTVTCFAGLCDTAVPVQVGKDLLGFLQTGQVALKQPTRAKFDRVARQLVQWGVQVDLKKLEEAYFHTRILSQKQYSFMLKLLEIFAQHMATVANQILVQHENNESPMIKRAKEFIQDRKSEHLSLSDVARVVNVSTFYFCKIFKKSTGLNFTDYLSRIRIEKARNLLLNPNMRVSEIAYEVGFQSLTHFNRVFRRVVGQSPTSYRKNLPAWNR